MSPAEREKRMQAARDAFGRPTPVPRGSERAASVEPDEGEEPTLREACRTDDEALPAEPVQEERPARATARTVPLRVVVVSTVLGLVVGGES